MEMIQSHVLVLSGMLPMESLKLMLIALGLVSLASCAQINSLHSRGHVLTGPDSSASGATSSAQRPDQKSHSTNVSSPDANTTRVATETVTDTSGQADISSSTDALLLVDEESELNEQEKITTAVLEDPMSKGLTLAELERLALENNPTLVQATAVIDAARGRMIQAGLYPNPMVGYSGGEIGGDGRAGQQGFVVGQEIVRGGKLELSRAVAGQELQQAEALADAQRYRVLNSVRAAYYTALAAERKVRITKELVELGEKATQIASDLLGAGQGTKQDVLQAEIELEQVRILTENAVNNYQAAWRQLAAIVGVRDLAQAPLEGDLEEGIPELTGEQALSRILALSPEFRVAELGVLRAQAAVARARVEPIPNVSLEAGAQYDYASRDTIVGVGLSLPLPIFNRNQGNILAAESELVRATRDVDRVKLGLSHRFAAVFAQYENARQQVEKYRERILPKARESLALVTEGYERGQFPFLQVLVAQRTLAQVSMSYLAALADLRVRGVEIEGLLLIDGLDGGGLEPLDGLEGGHY